MTNREVIERCYAAFNNGDMVEWAKFCHPNAKFHTLGNLPTSGVFTGPEDIIHGCLSKIPMFWSNFQVKIRNIYEAGDTCFVHCDMTARNLTTEGLHMMRISNDQFTFFQAFDDTGQMQAAMEQRAAGAN
ncbi:nuclear transport factor 2 family protein [Pontibacter sp. G13]|uniref:nuclear transport factor 2 family protein n=1 Tax=Pontibacter sp. G13 TaxID=3074898 RepID=UPI00288B9B10|nr:nuclear transport factor 2 family protein [Pontibacter sp. G13]WNJ20363.1 nuclear transport factor 2 family protein [Pontibacter sp. G13]